MRKITFYTIILSLIFLILSIFTGNDLITNMIFIFEQPYVFLGEQIRSISLSGAFGNGIAILIYILVSGIPLWILGMIILKKKAVKLDYFFLPVLSASLFLVMYLMINQRFIIELMPSVLAISVIDGDLTALRIYNVGIIMTLDVLVLIYLFIRYFMFKSVSVYKLIQVILYVLIFAALLKIFLIDFKTLMHTETVNSFDLAQEIFSFIFKLASSAIMIVVLIFFQQLSNQLESNAIDLKVILFTKKISKLSMIFILITFSGILFINIYQIIFSHQMLSIGFVLDIPLFELFLIMVMLLITEYIKKTYDVHEENALTI